MSKNRNKPRKSPAFSPEVMLRPRLDQLFADPARLAQPDEALRDELDAMVQGCRPNVVASTLLSAYLAAPATARARLEQLAPGWLAQQGYVPVLEKLITDQPLQAGPHAQVLAWLEATGGKTSSALSLATDWFYRAYRTGNEWQAMLMVFWYSHPKRNRVRGMSFLIDWNPPWEGAVKDILSFPNREPREALREFVEPGRTRAGIEPQEISAAQAKHEVLQALACNRAQDIRLPQDLIAARDIFLRYILTLPDEPDAPPFGFSAEDFDDLSTRGLAPESIMNFEHNAGRLVRLDDGSELLVDPALAEMDTDDLDDEDDTEASSAHALE